MLSKISDERLKATVAAKKLKAKLGHANWLDGCWCAKYAGRFVVLVLVFKGCKAVARKHVPYRYEGIEVKLCETSQKRQ